MEDTIIFIDAGYLSLISKFLGKGKPLIFDIYKFAKSLCNKQALELKKVYYYTAPPYESAIPTEKEIIKKSKYQKFVNKLRDKPNFIVREGRCQKIDDTFQQKGVDTLMTMDLLETAHHKEAKTIIILACDTDFVPILKRIKEEGIKVILYYFTDFNRKSQFFLSNHIAAVCDKKVLLKKRDFENIPIQNPDK